MPLGLRAGRQVFWQRFGEGPRPALAIHCGLAHSGAWAGVATGLADLLALTAFDLPGHGRSADWDGQGDYIAQAAAIADTFLTEPMDLIGHSGGAVAALRLALAAPDLVRSLTLIEPVLFAAARGTDEWTAHHLAMAPYAEALARDDRDLAARRFIEVWGADSPWDALDARQRRYLADRIGLMEACEPALAEDIGGLLATGAIEALDMPVMLIAGQHSPPIIHAIHEELAARLWDVGVAQVDEAGHMAPMTHPTQVAGLIRVNVTRD
jgi:pimeloyl-ACP methyl ester carboxylesterase